MMSLHLENSRQITNGAQGKNSLIYHSTDVLHGQQWVAMLKMFEVHIDAGISDGYLFPLFTSARAHVCMCVCVYAYTCMLILYALAYLHVSGHDLFVEARGQCQGSSFIATHLIFLRQDCSLTLELINCLNQLAGVVSGPTCLHSPSSGVTDACYSSWLLCGYRIWRLCDKHFTDWAISPSPLVLVSIEASKNCIGIAPSTPHERRWWKSWPKMLRRRPGEKWPMNSRETTQREASWSGYSSYDLLAVKPEVLKKLRFKWRTRSEAFGSWNNYWGKCQCHSGTGWW